MVFELRKSNHSKTFFVLLNGEEIDQIHYDNIDELCNCLKQYSDYLMEVK